MTTSEMKAYRMLAARLNYMAQDNPMLQFPAKEVCRSMSNPEVGDFSKVKRLVRFLKGLGRVKLNYEMQEEEARQIVMYVDSDWAGCMRTRRSTTGGNEGGATCGSDVVSDAADDCDFERRGGADRDGGGGIAWAGVEDYDG